MSQAVRANVDALAAAAARVKASLSGAKAPTNRVPADSSTEDSALGHIVQSFRLSPFERDILVLCASIELDPEVPAMCAVANANSAAPYPTFALALARLPGAHWSAFAPQAPLRRWRLIEPGDGSVMTTTPLHIDERVLHYLIGMSHLDARLAMLIDPLEPVRIDELALSHASLVREMRAAWSVTEGEVPVVQMRGASADCRPIAAAAGAQLGVRAATLSLNHIPHSAAELEAFVRLWEREIALGGFGVLLIEQDDAEMSAGEDPFLRVRSIMRLVDRLTGPVVVRDSERRYVTHRTTHVVDVDHPLPQEQSAAWHEGLGEVADQSGCDIDAVVAQFDMSLPVIRDIAVRATAQTDSSSSLTSPAEVLDIVWDLCRARSRALLEDLAERIDSRVGWDDLILPLEGHVALQSIVAQLRQRMTVYEHWGFAAKSSRGLGISALFTGPSGTGKTMAAEVLATALRLDLYRIDLSSVVSKYIGETEKNLRRVFDAAEEGGAILLFDEADALFGKRTEVRDSHDRFANIEVSYLLQRMEAYRGLAILTTNMKSALDPSFLRRLRFVVQFPFPDVAQRIAIWQRIFPDMAPIEDLDFAKLANLQIAGGNIRNIALNAAFLAADAAEPVRMRHVLAAMHTEYAKLERHLTVAEGQGWT